LQPVPQTGGGLIEVKIPLALLLSVGQFFSVKDAIASDSKRAIKHSTMNSTTPETSSRQNDIGFYHLADSGFHCKHLPGHQAWSHFRCRKHHFHLRVVSMAEMGFYGLFIIAT